jgi:hypothetical protein
MTVLPFRTPASTTAPGKGPPGTTAELVGTFPAPSGARGTVTGTYRLERLVDQFGQLAAAGIFTGELRDADGTHVGIASRRLTCAAFVDPYAETHVVRIGPVDVNLLGFMVTVDEFCVGMGRELRALPTMGRSSGSAGSASDQAGPQH